MSKAIKQFFVVAAVVAISMVFVIQFRPGTNVEVTGGPICAIEISGDCIQHADFVASFRMAAPNIEGDALKQLRLRKTIIDGLVERWLLVADAERLGIKVSDEQVTQQMGTGFARFSLPVAQEETYLFLLNRHMPGQVVPAPIGPARRMLVNDPKTNKFDYERYQRWVANMSRKTLADFREYQRAEAVAARMRALVRARVRVSEKEAFARFARENEKVVADYLKLERAFYRDYVLDRSDEALDKWSADNKSEVDERWEQLKEAFLPECRQARHILVRFDETIPDEAERANKAQAIIDAAKKRLDEGEAFGKVAKDVSQDQRTAKEGGKLGCFAKGKLAAANTSKQVDDGVFALESAGAVSDVIKTETGLHLVKLDKINDEAAAEKVGRREIALDLYLQKESERLAAEGAKQILEAVRGGKKLQAALDAHLDAVLPAKAKEAFERGRAKGDGGDEGDDEGGDDEGDDDEGGDDEGDDEVDAWTDPTRPQIRTSDAFTEGSPPFSQVQSPPEAARMIFELKKVGDVPPDLIKLYDGYAVAQLKERKAVDDKTWDEQRDEFIARMRRGKQQDALIAYVARLREQNAKEITYRINLDESAEDPSGSE
jgi:peptidyl-prolyl cis-trans isomerase D